MLHTPAITIISDIDIKVKPIKNDINYRRCPRCAKYHQNILNFRGHTEEEIKNDDKLKNDCLCNRCVVILQKYFDNHESIPYIEDNLKNRGMNREDNPEWDRV